MTRHYVLPAARLHDIEAWLALVSGTVDLAANPLPPEPVERCRFCGGEVNPGTGFCRPCADEHFSDSTY